MGFAGLKLIRLPNAATYCSFWRPGRGFGLIRGRKNARRRLPVHLGYELDSLASFMMILPERIKLFRIFRKYWNARHAI
jgi:hypothetical protein